MQIEVGCRKHTSPLIPQPMPTSALMQSGKVFGPQLLGIYNMQIPCLQAGWVVHMHVQVSKVSTMAKLSTHPHGTPTHHMSCPHVQRQQNKWCCVVPIASLPYGGAWITHSANTLKTNTNVFSFWVEKGTSQSVGTWDSHSSRSHFWSPQAGNSWTHHEHNFCCTASLPSHAVPLLVITTHCQLFRKWREQKKIAAHTLPTELYKNVWLLVLGTKTKTSLRAVMPSKSSQKASTYETEESKKHASIYAIQTK